MEPPDEVRCCRALVESRCDVELKVLTDQRHVVTPVDLACLEDELLVHQAEELGERRDGRGDDIAFDPRDRRLRGPRTNCKLLLGQTVASARLSEHYTGSHFHIISDITVGDDAADHVAPQRDVTPLDERLDYGPASE